MTLGRIENEMVCILPSGLQEDIEKMLGFKIPDCFPVNVVSREKLIECCQCGALDYLPPEGHGRTSAIMLSDGRFICKACARLDPYSTIEYLEAEFGDGFSTWNSQIDLRILENCTDFKIAKNFAEYVDAAGKKFKVYTPASVYVIEKQ